MQIFTIGRDANNDIVLNDNFTSRKHAQLILMDDGKVLLKDMQSANGTFVNGNRITEYYLKSSDVVKCASMFLNWQDYINTPHSNQSKNQYQQSIFNQPVNQNQQFASNQPNNQSQQAVTNQPVYQNNIITIGNKKSVGLAFLLSFLFGPLGLLYASVTGGIVMFLLGIIIGIITFGMGLIIVWPICIIWAVVAANKANTASQKMVAGMINNQNKSV